MPKVIRHITIPAAVSALFFIAGALPLELIGCRNRGIVAAVVAIAAGGLGIAAAVRAITGRIRGDANSFLWMVSAFLLAIPALFIVLSTT